MCKITVTYDTKKRDQLKKDLEREGISLQYAIRLYLDLLTIKPELAKGLATMIEDEEDNRAAEEAEKRLLSGKAEVYTIKEVRKHLGL